MYELVRKTHLFCGLLVLMFLVVYAVSGAAMFNPNLLARPEPVTTTSGAVLEYSGTPADPALQEYIRTTFGIRGRAIGSDQRPDGTWRFEFARPGVRATVDVSDDLRTATLTEHSGGVRDRLIALHKLRGYEGGVAFGAWAFFLDLVALSMIVFSLTGVYLWYKSTRDRRLGWTILVGSWTFTVGTVLYLTYFS